MQIYAYAAATGGMFAARARARGHNAVTHGCRTRRRSPARSRPGTDRTALCSCRQAGRCGRSPPPSRGRRPHRHGSTLQRWGNQCWAKADASCFRLLAGLTFNNIYRTLSNVCIPDIIPRIPDITLQMILSEMMHNYESRA